MRSFRNLVGAALVAALGILAGVSLLSSPGQAQNGASKSTGVRSAKPAANEPAKLATEEAKQPVAPLEPDAFDRIMKKLEEPTTFDFQDSKLDEVVEFLTKQHHLSVQVERKALEEAAFDTATPINYKVVALPLRSALRLLLNEYGLCYGVEHDTLCITSKTAMENRAITRVYPVADLIVADDGTVDTISFIEMLRGTIQPNCWKANGGQGDMLFHLNRVLVVSNTQEVHEELSELLAMLRRAERATIAGKTSTRLLVDQNAYVRRVYHLWPGRVQVAKPAPVVPQTTTTPTDIPIPLVETSQMSGSAFGTLCGGLPGPPPGIELNRPAVSPDKTIGLIKAAIAPKSWSEDSAALILAGPQSVVVVQKPAVQREIQAFLTELQALRDLPVGTHVGFGGGGNCQIGGGGVF